MNDLVDFLRRWEEHLPGQDRDRLERNPLRVLDSKDEKTQEILRDAPQILDYLCSPCQAHWAKLRHGLDSLGIRYEINQRLVRGLDYYTRSVFEYVPPVDGAQSTVGGGGRYDGLSQAMGGPHVPGIGFGAGIERLILNLKRAGVVVPQSRCLDAYIAHVGAGTEEAALKIAYRLRETGLWVDMAFGTLGMKAQMKRADTSRARFAVIVGEDELAQNSATVRCLADGVQQVVPIDELAKVLSGEPG